MSNDPQFPATWQRRLARLANTIDDVASAQGDLQAQIDQLTQIVEGLTRPATSAGKAGGPGALRPPPNPSSRTWLRPVSRLARAGVRATLGVARRAWDVANPRPPWADQVRVQIGAPAQSLPSLTIVVRTDEKDRAGSGARGGTSNAGSTGSAKLQETLCRVRGQQTDTDADWLLWSPTAATLHSINAEGTLRQAANGTTPGSVESDYLWTLTTDQLASLSSTAVETAKLGLAHDRPCFLRLDDRARSSLDPQRSTLIVKPALWHPRTDIDLPALRALAARDDTGVLGRDSGGTPYATHTVVDGHPFRDAAGPILRRVDGWWVPARSVPRNYTHPVQPPPPIAPVATDPGARATVLVVLATPLVGGCERQLADLLTAAGDDLRIILAQVVTGGALAAARWQMLSARAAHAYRFSTFLPEVMHARALRACARRWQAQRVLVIGVDRWLDDHAADWLTESDQPHISYLAWDGTEAETAAIHRLRPVEPLMAAPPAITVSGDVVSSDGGAMLRASLGIPSQAMVVGFRADLVVSERPEDFVMVADRLRDDHRMAFLLAGRGPLSDRVTDLMGLLPPSRFFRAPPDLDVDTFLAACDVVCSTAERRPVLTPLRRAALAKRPIVATHAGEIDRLLDDGPCGLLVEPGDVAGLAAALTVLVDPAVRAAYASAGPAAAARTLPADPRMIWRSALGIEPTAFQAMVEGGDG